MKSIGMKTLALFLSLITVFSVLTGCTQTTIKDKDTQKDSEKEESESTLESEFEDTNADVDSDSDSDYDTESDTESDSESASESASDSESESESETTTPSTGDGITVFANGAYSANFIRADLATAFDTNIYNQVRDLFKDKTGTKPALKTDFTAANAEKYNGPAILIGDTNYPETATVKKSLKDNQAIAKLVGNKFVIVYSSSDAATKLLETLKSTIKKKATATEIKIDSSWDATAKVTTSYSENTSFKDSGLTQKVDIASLGLGTAYNAGQGCKT